MADMLLQGVHEIAIDAVPHGIVVCDEAGRILFANRRILAMFGYSRDELSGAAIDMLLGEPARDGEEWVRSWMNLSSESMRSGRELLGRGKDGSEVPIQIELNVVNQDGRRLVIASVVDISERRQLQQALQRAAAERLIFERLVSELRQVIEPAVMVGKEPHQAPDRPAADGHDDVALARIEADHIRSVLARSGWRVRGKGGAAELLQMKPTTLESRMAKLGIHRPHRRES